MAFSVYPQWASPLPKNVSTFYFPSPRWQSLVDDGFRPKVLIDDEFSVDSRGWCQLMTPSQTAGQTSQNIQGSVSLVKTGGQPVIVARTGRLSGGQATAIKRVVNFDMSSTGGSYLLELYVNFTQVEYSTDRPAAIDFCLDTCIGDGTRRLFGARWLNYNWSTATQVQQWMLPSATGTAGPQSGFNLLFGGAAWTPSSNENKTMLTYLAMVVNTTTGVWEGFCVGHGSGTNGFKGAGTMNPAGSDQTLVAFGPVTSSVLSGFVGGINPMFTIYNRGALGEGAVTITAGQCGIAGCRLTQVGGFPS